MDEPPQPVWLCAPADMVPGVVPVELILGRSENAVVLLTGIRAFPTGLDMTLSVRLRGTVRRGDLGSEVYDDPYAHDRDAGWYESRLKWGIEFADGRRVTNIDVPPYAEEPIPGRWTTPEQWGSREPDHAVLQGGGAPAGSGRSTAIIGCGRCRLQVSCAWSVNGAPRTSLRRSKISTRSPFSKLPAAPAPSGR